MANKSVNILLTRPLQKSQELAAVLAPFANHIEICPLFELTALPTSAASIPTKSASDVDIFIFISAAAVQFATQQLPSEQLATATIIAVGQATATQLHQQGVSQVHIPSTETSEGVLALPQLQQVKSKNIVIVRGNGGRELMYEELLKRGANVTYTEVYQRQWLPLNSQQALEKWRKLKINCIVVTSTLLLEKLLRVIDDLEFANQCTWLVVSERSKQRAHELGLTQVINSHGASHKHILASIRAQLMEQTHDK